MQYQHNQTCEQNKQSRSTSQNLAQALLKHQQTLKRFIRRSVHQESDVEDIYQKLLLKGLQRKDKDQIENTLSYGFKMAENIIADHIRECQRMPDELLDEPACEKIDLEKQSDYQQRLAIYQQVLANMSEQRREVFVRRKFNGQSRGEIAQQMSMTEEAVKKHIVRAMLSLKAAIEESNTPDYL